MSHHYIVISDLYYSYPDGTAALSGITFKVDHGESVAIVGANGAGKSTLLHLLNGSILPLSGSVNIGGLIITKKNLTEVRRHVGTVFSDPDDQLFMPTVFEDVAFGPLNLGWDDIAETCARALESVDAGHLSDRPPFRLSTGEKRRAALATVLVMSPDILVLDEPVSGLDPRARRRLIELLSGFHHTKLIATHDLDLAMVLCERTIIFAAGKVAADGRSQDILADASLLEAHGLELPLSLQACPVCASTGRTQLQ